MKRMISRRMNWNAERSAQLDFQRYLQQLGATPQREDVVAFFDLDRTIIAGYSITALIIEQICSGAMSLRHFLSQVGLFLDYGIGKAGYQDLLQATVAELVGMPEQELMDLGERAYIRRLRDLIYQEARALVDTHKALGHEVAMVTSATRYQADPIARDLGVDDLRCTELEVRKGLITGKVESCHGSGKKSAAIRLGIDRKTSLDDAYFYTDSYDDLPLLEAVGKPVTVNAKSSLSQVAAARDWPQLAFENQGGNRPPRAASDRRIRGADSLLDSD
jgi:putative phosphoserine phosphatase/1-acylglycerol-3-phosphate O-acyltransferase